MGMFSSRFWGARTWASRFWGGGSAAPPSCTPPANDGFLTATNIPSFPASVSQNVHCDGTNYTVYYKFTAPANGLVYIFGFGGTAGSGYQPNVEAYRGPAGGPTFLTSSQANRPIQIQVAVGVEYFLRFNTGAGDPTPAILTITLQYLVPVVPGAGDLLVNDDTEGFPAIILSPTADYTVLASVSPFVAGEAGDALDNGVLAFSDEFNDKLVTYDEGFNVISEIDTSTLGTPYIRTQNGTKFYVGFDGSGDVKVRDLLATGSFGSVSFTLTGITSIKGIAANNDETILYFAESGLNEPIQRWDLVNNVPLSDFVAGIASLRVVDILVLVDGTIVALYVRVGSGSGNMVKRYATDGSELASVSFSSILPVARLAYSSDRETFWVMSHDAGVGIYTHYALDGSVIAERRHAAYEGGGYTGAQSATPPIFGASESCPLVVLRTGEGPGPEPEPEPIETLCPGGGLFLAPGSDNGHGCTRC